MSKFEHYDKIYKELKSIDCEMYQQAIEVSNSLAIRLNLDFDESFTLEASLVSTILKLSQSKSTDNKSLLQRILALEEENERLKQCLETHRQMTLENERL